MRTWRKYRTYTRVQSLWQEYKEVALVELNKDSKDGRLVLVSQKLRAFLDGFQSAYHEFKSEFSKSSSASANSALNAFYGDCTELLLSLLELVDRHNQQSEPEPETARLAEEAAAAGGNGRGSPAEVATKVKGMVEKAKEKASETVDPKLVDKMRQVRRADRARRRAQACACACACACTWTSPVRVSARPAPGAGRTCSV